MWDFSKIPIFPPGGNIQEKAMPLDAAEVGAATEGGINALRGDSRLTSTDVRPSPQISPAMLVRRKCAHSGASGVSGECPSCQGAAISGGLGFVPHSRLTIVPPGDEYEREADRVANAVMNRQPVQVALRAPAGGDALVQSKCAECEAEAKQERSQAGGYFESIPEDEVSMLGGAPARVLRRKPMPGHEGEAQAPPRLVPGQGEPIVAPARKFLEARLNHDFSHVRVHAGSVANESAHSLGALAFTTGSDIVFGRGRYSPESAPGLRLLAHELTHVVQQGHARQITAGTPQGPEIDLRIRTGAPTVQRLPLPPPDAPAPAPAAPAAAPLLTPAQVQQAIKFNQLRFKDPFDIRTIRELMGMDPFPAIVDEAFVLAVAQWQTDHPGLTVDGQVGAATTQTYLVQLRADGQARLAKDLAEDNFVLTTSVGGTPVFNMCPNQPGFGWDVSFNTTLRSGFIVQEVASTFNATHCDGTPYVGPLPTMPRYWEAWQVDANGNVTPGGAFNDRWQRGWCNAGTGPPQCANRNSRGNWTMAGRFFTPLTLPPAAHFAAGAVPDAGILQSTVVRPNADHLGLVAGSRTIGGRWDCCPPNNTHVRT
jgi:hypothetical protein